MKVGGLEAQPPVKAKLHRGRGFDEKQDGNFLNGTEGVSYIFGGTSLLNSPYQRRVFVV